MQTTTCRVCCSWQGLQMDSYTCHDVPCLAWGEPAISHPSNLHVLVWWLVGGCGSGAGWCMGLYGVRDVWLYGVRDADNLVSGLATTPSHTAIHLTRIVTPAL